MRAQRSSRQLWTAKLRDKAVGASVLGKKVLTVTDLRPSGGVLHGKKRAESSKKEFLAPFKGIILGVDPSLRRTGLAVIDYQGPGAVRLAHAMALPFKSSIPFATCLAEIAKALAELLKTYPIQHLALEQTIFVQNHNTAQIMGAVRGAIIATAALQGLPVFEYPPLRIKQALTGFGRASKEQVAKTVAQILKIPFNFSLDEGDAAAAALCHAFTHKS